MVRFNSWKSVSGQVFRKVWLDPGSWVIPEDSSRKTRKDAHAKFSTTNSTPIIEIYCCTEILRA
jgi:hypothetical protein